MHNCRKIIINCPDGYKPELDAMIESYIQNKVQYIGIVGKDSSRIEDIINEIIVGDGHENRPFILTAFHPNETIDDAVELAMSLSGEFTGEVQIVTL